MKSGFTDWLKLTPEERRQAKRDLKEMSDAEYYEVMAHLHEKWAEQDAKRAMEEADASERAIGQKIVALYGDADRGYTRIARQNQRGRNGHVEHMAAALGEEWVARMLDRYSRDHGIGDRPNRGSESHSNRG
jgi:hypothetical protein